MALRTQIIPERYRDAELIARGAMGDIYCATDSVLGRVVALKLLAEPYVDDDSVQRRFSREARAAARLSSDPNIVTIYDVGETAGHPYIVMEYMSGGSLEKRLRTSGIPTPAVALAWLAQAARGARSRARAGRRPPRREARQPAARRAGPGARRRLRDRQRCGDGHADERGNGARNRGVHRARAGERPARDSRERPLRARGVAFELLTGQRPFESESPTAEAAAHVSAPIPLAEQARAARLVRRIVPPRPRKTARGPLPDVRGLRRLASGGFRHRRPNDPGRSRSARAGADDAGRAEPAGAAVRAKAWTNWPLVVAILGALVAAGVVAAVMLPNDSKQGAQTPVRRQTTSAAQPKAKSKPKKKAKTTPAATTPTTTAAAEPTTTAAAEPTTTASAERTTTASAEPATTAATPAPTAAVGPHTLNDRAWALMQQGRYSEALPMLEQAVPALRGAGPSDLAEGYANYNLGYTLYKLDRCDEAKPYLDRAKKLEPYRTEVDAALEAVKQCAQAAK